MDERNFSPESHEGLPDVQLSVVEPRDDKHHMISFTADTEGTCFAYNNAIRRALTESHLQPFHQVGMENEPGYHAWEVWAETDTVTLTQLLPTIHQQAKENFASW